MSRWKNAIARFKSKLDAEGSQNDNAKTLIKFVIYCTFAQNVKKTMFSEINDFPQKCPNRYLGPRGLPWSARRPRRESLPLPIPLPFTNTTTIGWLPNGNSIWKINENSHILQDWCQIGVKIMQNQTLKKLRVFPLYFMILSAWNDKFLTPPSQTLIAHDIHNYNELKHM